MRSSTEHDCRVARAVVVSSTAVTCVDWLERWVDTRSHWRWLPSSTGPRKASWASRGSNVRGLDAARVVRGSERPFAGWHSTTYGAWSPATWIDLDRSRRRSRGGLLPNTTALR